MLVRKKSTQDRQQNRMARVERPTGRAVFLALLSLAALLLTAHQSPAATDLTATIRDAGDGTATVNFQSVDSNEKIAIYTANGEPLGKLNWEALFKVSVTKKALKSSTTPEGIDLSKLIEGVELEGDKMLVKAELPYSATDLDGRELEAGTQVYFSLPRLVKKGAVEPVNADGTGDAMGPGAVVNEFNDRLYESGVRGAKTKAAKAGKTSAHSHGGGAHGLGNTPLQTGAPELDLEDTRYLTSPTCTVAKNQRMRISSYFGQREPFRTKNGRWATKYHKGLDIAGATGTPIVTAGEGCMKSSDIQVNRYAGYGLSVVVDHGNGLKTQYSHMKNIDPAILAWKKTARQNDTYCLARGASLGQIGQTGSCSGPHLHFGTMLNGKPVDPRRFMRAQTNPQLSTTCENLAASNALLTERAAAVASTSGSNGRLATAPVSR